MKIAVLGSTGQLGSDLCRNLQQYSVVPLTRKDADVTDVPALNSLLQNIRPEVIINATAFHNVEECEKDPARAFLVNAVAVRSMAFAAVELGSMFVHFSTDYVFDGRKKTPYVETDTPNPINAYGISKYAGEIFIRSICENYYIFRVASLFGKTNPSGKGLNFVEKIVEKARKKESIQVVDDIIMSPTAAVDVAMAVKQAIAKRLPPGLYHCVNSGFCSWFEYAREIVRLIRADVPVSSRKSEDLFALSKTKRPINSALSSELLTSRKIGLMRPWQEALKIYLQEQGYIPQNTGEYHEIHHRV